VWLTSYGEAQAGKLERVRSETNGHGLPALASSLTARINECSVQRLARFGSIGVDVGDAVVGTALAVIVPTSIPSFLGHYKKGAVDLRVLKTWAIPSSTCVLGAITVASVAKPVSFMDAFVSSACSSILVAANGNLQYSTLRAQGAHRVLRSKWSVGLPKISSGRRRPLPILIEQGEDAVGRYRPTDEISLDFITAGLAQTLELLGGLDAFRDYANV
jgi:uncharacterized membrane protein YfcA